MQELPVPKHKPWFISRAKGLGYTQLNIREHSTMRPVPPIASSQENLDEQKRRKKRCLTLSVVYTGSLAPLCSTPPHGPRWGNHRQPSAPHSGLIQNRARWSHWHHRSGEHQRYSIPQSAHFDSQTNSHTIKKKWVTKHPVSVICSKMDSNRFYRKAKEVMMDMSGACALNTLGALAKLAYTAQLMEGVGWATQRKYRGRQWKGSKEYSLTQEPITRQAKKYSLTQETITRQAKEYSLTQETITRQAMVWQQWLCLGEAKGTRRILRRQWI